MNLTVGTVPMRKTKRGRLLVLERARRRWCETPATHAHTAEVSHPSLFDHTGVHISSSHLDAIRTITSHLSEFCLASGSDDAQSSLLPQRESTARVQRSFEANLSDRRLRSTVEVEPQLTLRGHSADTTKLIHIPSVRALISASLDSSIRIRSLPPPSHTTYAPYDGSRAIGELIGHTDVMWDLALIRDQLWCGAIREGLGDYRDER